MTTNNFRQMSLDQLIQSFHKDIWIDNDAYLYNITYEIAQCGNRGEEYLLYVLNSSDEDENHQRAALAGISSSKMKKQDIVKILWTYLHDPRPSIVSEAIDGLIHVKEFSSWKKIEHLLEHASEYVRGAVLRYACRALSEEDAFPILLAGLRDSHFIVIENAIDELDELGNPEAIPHIKPFLKHSDSDVRQAAKTAIENLTDIAEE